MLKNYDQWLFDQADEVMDTSERCENCRCLLQKNGNCPKCEQDEYDPDKNI